MNWSNHTKELLATHEALRRLKYPSASLFVVLNGPQVLVKVEHLEKEFIISIGVTDKPEEVGEEWQRAVDWWNAQASDNERSDIYQNSYIRTRATDLVMALRTRGMFPVKFNQ